MKSKFLTRNLLLLSMLFVSITAWGDTTYKLTQVTSVTAGNKYVFVENGNALTTVSGKVLQSTKSFNMSGLIGNESYIWTLEATTGGFYIKMSTGKYLNHPADKTDMASGDSGSTKWTFVFTADEAMIYDASENRMIANSSGTEYRAYKADADGLYYYPHHNFAVYAVVETVTVTTAKYATYCSTNALDFSGTGAKVYKAKVTGSSVKLTEITGGIVPANTGVMVYKDVAATENLSVPVTLTDATVTDNELVGITEETTVPWTADGKYNYILQKQGGDETPKFYKATGKKLVANRAYLSTTYNVASGRGLDIVFEGEEEEDDVTGVASVARPQATNNHCYDLQGRQVMQPTQKGLYIVNGKKYVVK